MFIQLRAGLGMAAGSYLGMTLSIDFNPLRPSDRIYIKN